jgi:hypothetical protein
MELLQVTIVAATEHGGATGRPSRDSHPVMKAQIMVPGNYVKHNVVYSEAELFYHSFICTDCISFQATRQIFLNRSA